MNTSTRHETPNPEISVIVVNFNGLRQTLRCLQSLKATTGIRFEILVVDNASTDGSSEVIRTEFPDVQLLRSSENLGFGRANQIGANSARSPFLTFLNNDTVVDPGWLEALLRPLLHDEGIAATCSTLIFLDEPHLYNARGGKLSRLGFGADRDLSEPIETACSVPHLYETVFPTGAAMLIRRKDFEELGGFDSTMFMYHEDVDLGIRLWLRGRRVVAVADSLVFHECGATTRVAKSLQWRRSMGYRHLVRTLLKCYEWHTLRSVLPAHFRVLCDDPPLLLSVAAWNLWHLSSTLRERRFIQKKRSLSDQELFERGLISSDDYLPENPRPNPILKSTETTPFRSHYLFVGEPSGESRLISGWHAPELADGSRFRWTNGSAHSLLYASKGARGTLEIQAQLPNKAITNPYIEVTCNGVEFRNDTHNPCLNLSFPVIADEAGVLNIEIKSAMWSPRELEKSDDPRTLGCRVLSLSFTPEIAAPVFVPRTIAVVIPTFNRCATLQKTLRALSEQSTPPTEVIVINDGSTDETGPQLEKWLDEKAFTFVLTVLHQKNEGPATARNRGISAAKSDLILFLGDDTIPTCDCIQKHLEAHLKNAEMGAVLGLITWDEMTVCETPFREFVDAKGLQFAYQHFQDQKEVSYLNFYSSNLSIARRLLPEQTFNQKFKTAAWEDVEAGFRIAQTGARIIYNSEAHVRHDHPFSLTQFLKRMECVGRNLLVLHSIQPSLRTHPAAPSPAPLNFPQRCVASSHLLPLWLVLDKAKIRLPTFIYEALIAKAVYAGAYSSQ